jgi:Na+/H+ antiporter NhaD/arsenite permease-like protein
MSHPIHNAVPESLMWLPNVILVVAYIFIAWEKVPKVVIALIGASIILMTSILTQSEALHFIDFNVIALLVGMMILVNILKKTGALNAVALIAAKQARGSGLKLLLLFAVITALLSAFLDNVTSVLLIGTVTISIARQLRINPVPFLIAETIASNIGGTATLIGDPPNIMIGSAAGLSFNDFLINLAPIIFFVVTPITLWTLAIIYKKDLKLPFGAMRRMLRISLNGVIEDAALMWKAITVILLVVVGFLFHHQIGIEAGTIALAGASLLMIFENENDIWEDVEWTTIFFFIGLFIIVGAVEKVGTIEWLANQFFAVTAGDYNLMAMLLLWASGILSAIIDNIPYTATMIPLVKNLQVINPETFANIQPLWWSLALGACLGGNGTLIGATANVLVADMAHRNGHPIKFVEFMKIGSFIMFESLLICSVYLWFRYLSPLQF